MQNRNNWGVGYVSIRFFEKALSGHKKVKSFERRDDIVFHIELVTGDNIRMLLVDEYTITLAALLRAIDEFRNLDFVVTSGQWNAYTKEAKQYGLDNELGVFIPSEFFGALHWSNPIKYAERDEDGNPIYRYRVA